MRVFLDANVLFTAAHNPKGKAALVITLGSEGLFQLATSAYAREEARRNLERKAPVCLLEFTRQLSKIRLVAENLSIPCPTDLAEKDWPIYRAAHACKANVLLTGDHRDFGFLMNAPELAMGLLIQPVADFLVALGAPAAFAE
jgi:predicted nucleic acid-binding protein